MLLVNTNNDNNINKLFPVFLKLEELDTLIVGGGNVALEKLSAVISNSPAARVTLVSPRVKEEIYNLSWKNSNISIINREYHVQDLDNKDIVIAATGNKSLNSAIKEEAKKKRLLVNVADTPDLCDFYLSSIVQKGSIKLAISTNGKSPTIAKRLKELLHNAIPDEMENVLDNLVKIRKSLNGNFSEKVKQLNDITSVLVEKQSGRKSHSLLKIYAAIFIAILIAAFVIYPYTRFPVFDDLLSQLYSATDPSLHWYVLAGFTAQMIDGILGMAYGVSATTFLLTLGIPPAAASASVHASEVFTSGASGLMHLKFGNVSKKLFKQLLLPGILGAMLGAYVLSSLEEYNYIVKPAVAAYTLSLGIIILLKAIRNRKSEKKLKRVYPLAGIGGFLDSVGGGGWGPIVTSTLIAKGKHPLTAIGSVNLAEFFVALASSAAFVTFLGITHWQIIAGLILGGIIAAPIAARTAGKLPARSMMLIVGILVIVVSLKIILSIF